MLRSLNLGQLGSRIEAVDRLLLVLLKHRMNLALNVGAFKRANGQDIIRTDKEDERIKKAETLAIQLDLNPHFAHALFYEIINEACKLQLQQFEKTYERPPDTQDPDEWYRVLKQNLLELTELVAHSQGPEYDSGFFASRLYRKMETAVLAGEVGKLPSPRSGLAVDLGCGTGGETSALASHFAQVVGFDVSQDMITAASMKGTPETSVKVRFQQADLEQGIPLPDRSASFVLMSMGTASDVKNIQGLVIEIMRILEVGGRFLLSFYNRDALVYRWNFLPWPLGLAAEINHELACLDVHFGGKVFSVYAQAYTVREVKRFFPEALRIDRPVTFPTVSPILPALLFGEPLETNCSAEEAVTLIDEQLQNSDLGAYIIVTGGKTEKIFP